MGKIYVSYIEPPNIYMCRMCNTHLSTREDLISKDFWAGNGKAFLFERVVNYCIGDIEDRVLRTGLHRVADIFCTICSHKIGWKYIWAQEPDQKYKEGKVILERNLIDKLEWA